AIVCGRGKKRQEVVSAVRIVRTITPATSGRYPCLRLCPARRDGARRRECMLATKYAWSAGVLTIAGALVGGGLTAHADDRKDNDDRDEGRRRTVFVVAMENHNWTQPATTTSPLPIFMNPDAPFINSLVNGTSGISDQVAYATHYINAGIGVHPSYPNYISSEPRTHLRA